MTARSLSHERSHACFRLVLGERVSNVITTLLELGRLLRVGVAACLERGNLMNGDEWFDDEQQQKPTTKSTKKHGMKVWARCAVSQTLFVVSEHHHSFSSIHFSPYSVFSSVKIGCDENVSNSLVLCCALIVRHTKAEQTCFQSSALITLQQCIHSGALH